MVAAAKLRRAKDAAEAARPYSERMAQVLQSLAAGITSPENAPALLGGTGKDQRHLLIVATSDRGLCGAFNSSIVRATRKHIRDLVSQGKDVTILCVGRKGAEQLQAEHSRRIIGKLSDIGKGKIKYSEAEKVALEILSLYEKGEFDVATIVYNHFKSAISQVVTFQQMIPLPVNSEQSRESRVENTTIPDSRLPTLATPYEYEPEEEAILADLLPRNIAVQVYHALLENAASEQGARMTAMDNATRNAGEMIKKLTLVYNRSRQAAITKELIEIISGAEAV